MEKNKYLSPDMNLKEVSSEDILNTSGEAVEEEKNELILQGSGLFNQIF